eukprot:jgi/Undpi1/10863/HiC_scaffold_3.g01389.m1
MTMVVAVTYMEVCIDNDDPPAPAGGGSTETLALTLRAKTVVLMAMVQEQEAKTVLLMAMAQEQEDHVEQQKEERQEGEPPGTPTWAAGGATGPAPEASGCTPTASRPAYSADALAARLNVLPLEGQTVEDVAAAVTVVAACLEFGVEMRRCDSKKARKRLAVV